MTAEEEKVKVKIRLKRHVKTCENKSRNKLLCLTSRWATELEEHVLVTQSFKIECLFVLTHIQ